MILGRPRKPHAEASLQDRVTTSYVRWRLPLLVSAVILILLVPEDLQWFQPVPDVLPESEEVLSR